MVSRTVKVSEDTLSLFDGAARESRGVLRVSQILRFILTRSAEKIAARRAAAGMTYWDAFAAEFQIPPAVAGLGVGDPPAAGNTFDTEGESYCWVVRRDEDDRYWTGSGWAEDSMAAAAWDRYHGIEAGAEADRLQASGVSCRPCFVPRDLLIFRELPTGPAGVGEATPGDEPKAAEPANAPGVAAEGQAGGDENRPKRRGRPRKATGPGREAGRAPTAADEYHWVIVSGDPDHEVYWDGEAFVPDKSAAVTWDKYHGIVAGQEADRLKGLGFDCWPQFTQRR